MLLGAASATEPHRSRTLPLRLSRARSAAASTSAHPAGDDARDAAQRRRAATLLQPQLDAIAGGGRLLIEDSLTYAQTPVFKVDGVIGAGRAGLEVVVAARNGARPLIAAGGDVTLADRRARHGWCSMAW